MMSSSYIYIINILVAWGTPGLRRLCYADWMSSLCPIFNVLSKILYFHLRWFSISSFEVHMQTTNPVPKDSFYPVATFWRWDLDQKHRRERGPVG